MTPCAAKRSFKANCNAQVLTLHMSGRPHAAACSAMLTWLARCMRLQGPLPPPQPQQHAAVLSPATLHPPAPARAAMGVLQQRMARRGGHGSACAAGRPLQVASCCKLRRAAAAGCAPASLLCFQSRRAVWRCPGLPSAQVGQWPCCAACSHATPCTPRTPKPNHEINNAQHSVPAPLLIGQRQA